MLDSQPCNFTVSDSCMIESKVHRRTVGCLNVVHGIFTRMKPLPVHEQHNLRSIDQTLVHNVIRVYSGCKANGQGEMAARNAAIVALREALPSWTFRAASDMVSRIIAGAEPTGQLAS